MGETQQNQQIMHCVEKKIELKLSLLMTRQRSVRFGLYQVKSSEGFFCKFRQLHFCIGSTTKNSYS